MSDLERLASRPAGVAGRFEALGGGQVLLGNAKGPGRGLEKVLLERAELAAHLRKLSDRVVDDAHRILCALAVGDVEVSQGAAGDGACAEAIGKEIAARATAAGIKQVCFDRGPFKYHGRVAALAEAARTAGLEF